MNNVVAIKSTLPEVPKLSGKLTCLTGKNKGKVYWINEPRIVMGRGKECKVQVYDQKSSREHAEIVKKDDSYIVTDLKSQNGIIINDLKISQYTLRPDDKIVIGQTVYKFSLEDEALSKLKNEAEDDAPHKVAQPSPEEEKKKRSFGIAFILLLLFAVFFIDEEEQVVVPKKANESALGEEEDLSEEVTKLLMQKKNSEDKELNEKLMSIFQRGLREFREKNYFRAINEFNLALILSPNHPKAEFYRAKTQQALDNDIEQSFLKAKRDAQGLRYAGAITSYCSIVRTLQNYPEDQRYKDSLENIKELETKMGIETGETKCL